MVDILTQQASPYHASVNWNFQGDTEEQAAAMYRKIDNSVTIDIRLALASSKTTKLILKIANKFGIKDPERMGEVARIVRDIFVDKISGQKVVNRVLEKLKVSPVQKDDFLTEIKQIILQIKEIAKEEKAIVFDEMAIIPAINKYKGKLSEQKITFERLKIPEINPEQEFEPTIKNWIEDYIQKKGAETHPILVRNDYLFNSLNTRGLNEEEREKLSEILESYDNDKLLLIYKLEGDPVVYFEQHNEELKKRKEAKKEELPSEFKAKMALEKPQIRAVELKKEQLPTKFSQNVNLPASSGVNNSGVNKLSATRSVNSLVIENAQVADYEKEKDSDKEKTVFDTQSSVQEDGSIRRNKLLILKKKELSKIPVDAVNLKKVKEIE